MAVSIDEAVRARDCRLLEQALAAPELPGEIPNVRYHAGMLLADGRRACGSHRERLAQAVRSKPHDIRHIIHCVEAAERDRVAAGWMRTELKEAKQLVVDIEQARGSIQKVLQSGDPGVIGQFIRRYGGVLPDDVRLEVASIHSLCTSRASPVTSGTPSTPVLATPPPAAPPDLAGSDTPRTARVQAAPAAVRSSSQASSVRASAGLSPDPAVKPPPRRESARPESAGSAKPRKPAAPTRRTPQFPCDGSSPLPAPDTTPTRALRSTTVPALSPNQAVWGIQQRQTSAPRGSPQYRADLSPAAVAIRSARGIGETWPAPAPAEFGMRAAPPAPPPGRSASAVPDPYSPQPRVHSHVAPCRAGSLPVQRSPFVGQQYSAPPWASPSPYGPMPPAPPVSPSRGTSPTGRIFGKSPTPAGHDESLVQGGRLLSLSKDDARQTDRLRLHLAEIAFREKVLREQRQIRVDIVKAMIADLNACRPLAVSSTPPGPTSLVQARGLDWAAKEQKRRERQRQQREHENSLRIRESAQLTVRIIRAEHDADVERAMIDANEDDARAGLDRMMGLHRNVAQQAERCRRELWRHEESGRAEVVSEYNSTVEWLEHKVSVAARTAEGRDRLAVISREEERIAAVSRKLDSADRSAPLSAARDPDQPAAAAESAALADAVRAKDEATAELGLLRERSFSEMSQLRAELNQARDVAKNALEAAADAVEHCEEVGRKQVDVDELVRRASVAEQERDQALFELSEARAQAQEAAAALDRAACAEREAEQLRRELQEAVLVSVKLSAELEQLRAGASRQPLQSFVTEALSSLAPEQRGVGAVAQRIVDAAVQGSGDDARVLEAFVAAVAAMQADEGEERDLLRGQEGRAGAVVRQRALRVLWGTRRRLYAEEVIEDERQDRAEILDTEEEALREIEESDLLSALFDLLAG
eukprot:TRINITY_DN7660_c0_g3_i1.p1 TRINITY_DN7660_c0_g3~~TRINITY_DN7660_c0_g3_i1.p1  ORF type:complete len:944 (+),score=248.05 TRINITY_DN7660_c0_g3_i1:39-2834(+)